MPQQRQLSESEFTAIRDRILREAPDGLSEADFTIWLAPRMAAALGEAESLPAKPEGSALGRFASNAAEMLNPVSLAAGMSRAISEPLQTIGAIGRDSLNQGRRALEDAQQGRLTESTGRTFAMFPVVGPAAAQTGEQIASGDYAGGAGRATGLLLPAAAPAVVRGTASAVRGIAPAGVREAAAGTLERGAAARYAETMAPKVGANKTRFGGMAEDVAPALAADPGMSAWSRSGLHGKVEAGLTEAVQALDQAADSRLAVRTFNTKPILDALLERRRQLTSEAVDASGISYETTTVNGKPVTTKVRDLGPVGQDVVPGPNAGRVAVIDQAIAEIKQLGPDARYESLRRIRQAYDGPAKAIYSPSMTADYMKAQGGKLGAADVTGALRDHLAKLDPATARANAQYSLYKTASDVLEATAEVERVRPKVGRMIMARLTGSMVGERAAGLPGAAAGYVFAPVVDAAMSAGLTTQLKTAQLMSRLAKAIRSGDVGMVTSLTVQLKRFGAQGMTLVGATTSPSGSQSQTTVSAR